MSLDTEFNSSFLLCCFFIIFNFYLWIKDSQPTLILLFYGIMELILLFVIWILSEPPILYFSSHRTHYIFNHFFFLASSCHCFDVWRLTIYKMNDCYRQNWKKKWNEKPVCDSSVDLTKNVLPICKLESQMNNMHFI